MYLSECHTPWYRATGSFFSGDSFVAGSTYARKSFFKGFPLSVALIMCTR